MMVISWNNKNMYNELRKKKKKHYFLHMFTTGFPSIFPPILEA